MGLYPSSREGVGMIGAERNLVAHIQMVVLMCLVSRLFGLSLLGDRALGYRALLSVEGTVTAVVLWSY